MYSQSQFEDEVILSPDKGQQQNQGFENLFSNVKNSFSGFESLKKKNLNSSQKYVSPKTNNNIMNLQFPSLNRPQFHESRNSKDFNFEFTLSNIKSPKFEKEVRAFDVSKLKTSRACFKGNININMYNIGEQNIIKKLNFGEENYYRSVPMNDSNHNNSKLNKKTKIKESPITISNDEKEINLSESVFSTSNKQNLIGKIKKSSCTCKQSKCLKGYCLCFSNGDFCNDDCSCDNCSNTINNLERRKIINKIEKKQKITNENSMITRGCNCSKSGCLKKYCFCAQNNIECNKNCRCLGCKNTNETPIINSNLRKKNIDQFSFHKISVLIEDGEISVLEGEFDNDTHFIKKKRPYSRKNKLQIKETLIKTPVSKKIKVYSNRFDSDEKIKSVKTLTTAYSTNCQQLNKSKKAITTKKLNLMN